LARDNSSHNTATADGDKLGKLEALKLHSNHGSEFEAILSLIEPSSSRWRIDVRASSHRWAQDASANQYHILDKA
jgi:hypothetical protein